MRIVEIDSDNLHLVEKFLETLGKGNRTFRYFNKRPISIINKHALTVLFFENEIPVGYGHLDPEDGKVWLGIALSEGKEGKGIGLTILNYLEKRAADQKISKLSLSVDKDNFRAIRLYQKNNFNLVKSGDVFYFEKNLLSHNSDLN